MIEEIFDIKVDDITYTIKTGLPVGIGNDEYEVWNGNALIFVIQPHTDEWDSPGWVLTPLNAKNGVDKEFISKVGEAIEYHGM